MKTIIPIIVNVLIIRSLSSMVCQLCVVEERIVRPPDTHSGHRSQLEEASKRLKEHQ